ncbi:MAG: HEAT repeat domain-containing protein [Planctomycetes bacterium]|nr:HEAT repeat domain-containing protein [Planctomycetota bacterium]
MTRDTRGFEPYLPKKSKKKGWAILFLLVGGPLCTSGAAYWFQLDDARLIASVRDRDVVAPYAAWAIGNKGKADEVQSELEELLADHTVSSYLRRGAANGLGSLKDPAVTRFLAEAIRDDPDPDVRAAACDALAASGVSNAEEAIRYVLVNDTESSPLRAACLAAGELQLEELIPLLIDNLETPDYRVRTYARESLVILLPECEAFGDNLTLWRAWLAER